MKSVYTVLYCVTVNKHALDHEVLLVEGGHRTLVLPREVGGGLQDVEGAVGGAVVVGRAVVQPQPALEHSEVLVQCH